MMRHALTSAAILAAAACGLPALAHPHAFADVSFILLVDADGRADGVQITWVYDRLLSLLVVEERGLDPDGDGVLTAEETTALQGFDQNWDPGFPGDFYIRQGGRDLPLSGPEGGIAEYRDGQLHSTFRRRIERPVDMAQPLSVQAYDPTFYTAYTLTGAPQVAGREDCAITLLPADIAAAQEKYGAALALIPPDQIPDESQFGDVGRNFADEVVIACPAP